MDPNAHATDHAGCGDAAESPQLASWMQPEDFGPLETIGTVDLEMNHDQGAEVSVWWPTVAVADDAPPVVCMDLPDAVMTPAAARQLAIDLVTAADRCEAA